LRARVLAVALAVSGSLAAAQAPAQDSAQPFAYRPPTAGDPPARLTSGVRGAAELPVTVNVLAPDHVGYTSAAQPTLYWFLSRPVDARVEVTVSRDDQVEPLVEEVLDPPVAAGVHALRLAAHAASLEPGVQYQWYVAVVRDQAQRSGDLLAGGAVALAPLPAPVAREIAGAGPVAAARAYAAAGFWYDAMDALAEAAAGASAGPTPLRLRAALLEQVGLEEAAAHDRAQAAR
jgi:hypothetical protein